MKKKLLPLILLVILSFAVTGCLPKKGGVQTGQDQMDQTQQETPKKDDSFVGSIKDLMAKAMPLMCTFSAETEDGDMEGTVYVHGEKVRTDTSMDVPELGNVDTHYISDGTWAYTWGAHMEQGIKMNLADLEGETPDASEMALGEYEGDYKGTVDMDGRFAYDCKPWMVDSSKFAPPSDVTFMDMGEWMKDIQEQFEGMEDLNLEELQEQFGM